MYCWPSPFIVCRYPLTLNLDRQRKESAGRPRPSGNSVWAFSLEYDGDISGGGYRSVYDRSNPFTLGKELPMIAEDVDLERVKRRYLDYLSSTSCSTETSFFRRKDSRRGSRIKGKIVMFLADENLVVKIHTNDQLADA